MYNVILFIYLFYLFLQSQTPLK